MKRILAAVVTGVLIGAPVTGAGPQSYAVGPVARADGTLAVRVVRDITGSGAYQPALALGVAGAPITVTDAAGKTATATTAADGTATVGLSGLTGGKYRVDGAAPAGSKLQPAPAGQGLSPLTSFVDVSDGKNVSLVLGLWNPADYCQENPVLVTGCQRNGIKPGVDNSARSLVSMPFTARGAGTAPTKVASQGDTGTIYGIAYRKVDQRVFSGAFAKRGAAYGPGAQGAVYVTDMATKTTKLFTKVPNAGGTAHAMQTVADGAFADVVGKESLGDIDISEDGSTLYVVNLADGKLYLYDATVATAAAAKASYAIPDPGCPVKGDWRPGALGVRDGVVYVGGVCSGESTQKQTDMRVVVRTFDQAAGTFGAPVLTKTLDFQRGTTLWQGTPTDRWLPWQAKFKQPTPTGGLVENPEPLLTDIGVETGGDLVLAFRDRFGDQGGRAMPPADGSSGLYDTVSGGDLNRACRQANGSFVWEGAAGCANNNVGASKDPNEAASVVEYYPGEYYTGPEGSPHHETAQGAVATVYSASRMPATIMDPTALNTGGVGWFDRANGTMSGTGNPNGYQISDTDSEGWGKANGLADLEALCDAAPVQIGNRTWFDTDRNGVQDPAEPAVAGVVVQLLACDGTGAPLATATTDANGLYYFGKAQGVVPKTCYTLKFDYSKVDPAKLPGAPPLAQLRWTTPNAGANTQINSKVDANGIAKVTTGDPGAVDHTQDAGITTASLNKLGDYVWVDTNKNGIQDAGEPPVPGVSVVVQNAQGTVVGSPKTTDAQGKYLFDNLPDGSYKVCFDIKKLPPAYADYLVTKQNAAGHNGTDSAADLTTGCTGLTELGPAKREDLTLDMGLVPPANRVGDLVWLDKDRDGVQDPGEPGVPGVVATLQDGTGKPVGSPVTTDPQGKYLFDNLPDGTYKVCFDLSKLPVEYAGAMWTKQNAASHNGTDSAVDPATGCTVTTELKAGHREDLTLDGGIVTPLNKLGDYVWVDANKNGIQDAGEKPVPGVKVTLQDGTGKPIGSPATTDAQGKYLFDNLPDGTYKVCFDVKNLPADYADYQVTKPNAAGHNGTDSAADIGTGCTMTTVLGPDKRSDLTLDMGIAPPVNRVGDLVWVDGNRNGIQDTGEPGVPGVVATLQDGAGKPVGSPVTTGDDGKYLFDNLPDGTYKVCFDLSKLPPQYAGAAWTKQNAASHNGADSNVDPGTGCTAVTELKTGHRVDLTLDGGIVTPLNKLGDYVWLDANKNGIQDAGEKPIPGVKVTLQDGTGKPVGEPATTDAQGKYLFDNLPDGTYKVCFDVKNLPADYADYQVTKPNAAGHNGTDSAADPATGCTMTTVLGPQKRADLTLDMGIASPVNRVGDYVWADSNKNGIQDAGEPGVPGMTVVLQDGDGKPVGDPVKTGPDGKYLFTDLPDGTYKVCFDVKNMPAGYADYALTKPNAAGHNGTDSAADLATACTPTTTLKTGHREDLTLDAGIVAPPNKIGDFVWYDKDKSGLQEPGEPGVPNVPVTLVGKDGETVASVKTDSDGKYLFENVPDGTYKVCFDLSELDAPYAGYVPTKPGAGGYNGKDSAVDPATKCTEPVTAGVGHRSELNEDLGIVPPVNRLGDFVWNDRNGNGLQDAGEPPLDDVTVTLKDGTGKVLATTKTGPDGKYLFTDLPDGKYQVCFPVKDLPGEYKGYTLTKTDAAGHNGKDSAADTTTGCTRPAELGPGHREDFTLDAGYLGGHGNAPAPPKPGWLSHTGAAVGGLITLAVLLLGGGGVLILVSRRRRIRE